MCYGHSAERPGGQSAKCLTYPQGHHRRYAFAHLNGELDHVPHQPDEPDPVPPITTDVHPPQPASPVGHPATPGVEPRNLPSPVSRPQRLMSVPKRLDGFDVTLPNFTK